MFNLRCVDLFAGCGGLTCGLQESGYDVVAAFDSWKPAIKCYELNFSHPAIEVDLSDVTNAVKEVSKHKFDLIAGGPPCQDFSHAGLRKEGTRAALTECFASVIKIISPQYFIMENVDRAQKSVSYKKARKILKGAGYGLSEYVLDASRCGVPQKRKRFFCIGVLGESDCFLDSIVNGRLLPKPLTVREHFKLIKQQIDIDYYYRHPRNYSRRGVFSVDEPAPTMRGVNRPVPAGYPGHSGDPAPVTKKLRPLTTYERALIQTFPTSFEWLGSKTDIEQMIGNAVPVNLAAFVGKCLKDYILTNQNYSQGESAMGNGEFREWLKRNTSYGYRTISNVISRLNRANSLTEIDYDVPIETQIKRMEESEAWSGLSHSVRSQLRKSVKLYNQYQCSRNA